MTWSGAPGCRRGRRPCRNRWRDERVAMSVLSADVDGVCIVLSQKIIDGIAYKEIKAC